MATKKTGGTANAKVVDGLRGFVADTFALMAKTQGCHWNMRGPNFIGLHKLTETQYGELFKAVDDLAERLRALDALAPTGLSEMDELASLEDAPLQPETLAAAELLAGENTLLASRATKLAALAEDEEDPVTHDMLVHRVEVHQKAAWLLRSHVA